MKQFSFVTEPHSFTHSWIKSYPPTVRAVFRQNAGGHEQPWCVTAEMRSLVSCDRLAAAAAGELLPGIGLGRNTEHSEPKGQHFAA